MKKTYIIIIAVVAGAVIIGLALGLNLKNVYPGVSYQGNIGVVEIEGIISYAKYIVQDLKVFKDDPSIKAVILRVDSPGGGVAASQEIYTELKKLKAKKKLVVSMGSVAASGGYYIALPADIIVANPGTITGSIGVIMEFPMINELMKKIGIDFEVIKSRSHKDIGSPFRKMNPEEKKLLHDVVLDVYNQFVEATLEERGLPLDSILKYADGRILSGKQAKGLGFIDTLGSFEDAVNIASDLVGIKQPNLVYPRARLSLIDLFTKPVEQLLIPKINFIWH